MALVISRSALGGRALTSSEGPERTGFRFCVAYVARPTAMMSCLVARGPHRVIFETAPVNAESPKLRSTSNVDYHHDDRLTPPVRLFLSTPTRPLIHPLTLRLDSSHPPPV